MENTKRKREWTPPPNSNVLRGAVDQLRLTWALFLDPDMPLLTKIIPLTALIYVVSPIDLVPFLFFRLGFLDDIGVTILSVALFNQLAPSDVALSHIHRLKLGLRRGQRQPPSGGNNADV